MRYFIFILFIMISSLFANDNIELYRDYNVKLLNDVKVSACGWLAYAWVLELEITETEEVLYAVVTCPDFYGKKFFNKSSIYTVSFKEYKDPGFSWDIGNRNEDFLISESLIIESMTLMSIEMATE